MMAKRECYLRMATQNRWPVRELARQIDSALLERCVLNPPKLSTALRELHPQPLALPRAGRRVPDPAAGQKIIGRQLHEFYALNVPGPDEKTDI